MLQVYLSLIAYGCATTFSPGPNNVLLLSSTSKYGFRRCFPLMCGIWTGLLTVMLICGFGCAILGELVPAIIPVAKYIGAAYILYLAYKTLFKKVSVKDQNVAPLKYYNGFLLQFLNVKILMLGIASYSGYILPYGFHVPYILIFAACMAGCAGTGNLIWATIGSLIYPFYERFNKIINVIMALLLVWCAAKIIML